MTWPVLALGARSQEVGNLQRFLNLQGCLDHEGRRLRVDEDFGVRTQSSLRRFQIPSGLPIDGRFSPLTREHVARKGFVPFIQALNCNRRWLPPRPGEEDPIRRQVRHIVLHTMESPEIAGTAESVARWFANEHAPKYPAPRASAHFNVDPIATVQCVRLEDVAWGVRGAYPDGNYVNDLTVNIEQAGRANQGQAGWDDALSTAILERTAKLVAWLCKRYSLPVEFCSAGSMRQGALGVTSHVEMTFLTNVDVGVKTDPGKDYPWLDLLNLVRGLS